MSRNLSSAALQSVFAPQTDTAFLILLTLDHTDLAVPIRVTSDAVETLSNGEIFSPFPFSLVLPDQRENQTPRARLEIDNIDRQIVQAVRSIASAPTVRIEIVRSADPNTVEAVFPDFKLVNVSYDVMTVTGDLSVENFTAEPYPAEVFSPAGFPALF